MVYKGPWMSQGGQSRTAHRTTILINKKDKDFLRETGFKPTNLLRIKIAELRNRGVSTDWEKAAEKLRKHMEKVFKAMEMTLSEEKFSEILKTANKLKEKS